jgi:hypothetical protein
MNGEIDIAGVLVHPLVLAAPLAFLLAALIERLLAWAGAYRFVWHRGLFDVALTIVLWAVMGAMLAGLPLTAAFFG